MCYKHCSLAHNHSAKELEAYKPATSTPSGLCHCSSQVVPILVRALSMGICSWFISHPGLDTLLSCNGQQQGQLFFFFNQKKSLLNVFQYYFCSETALDVHSVICWDPESARWICGITPVGSCTTNTPPSELDSHVPPVIPKPTLQVSWMSCWLWLGRVSNWLPASFPPSFLLLGSPLTPPLPYTPPFEVSGSVMNHKWCFLLTLTRAPIPLEKDADELHEVYFNKLAYTAPIIGSSNSFRAMAGGQRGLNPVALREKRTLERVLFAFVNCEINHFLQRRRLLGEGFYVSSQSDGLWEPLFPLPSHFGIRYFKVTQPVR